MRRAWPWLVAAAVALLPLALGGLLAAWVVFGELVDPRIYISAPISTWLILGGVGLSAYTLLAVAAYGVAEWQHSRHRAQVRAAILDERRQFLRRLDHELKNPLTAIQAGLALLRGEPAAPGNGHAVALGSVEAQVRRISRLTADLRKLADLESRPIETRPVNLADLLTQVYELTLERPEAADRRLSLALPQAPWPLPTVSGDFDLLLLVAHNLLDNAVKFSRPGDTLEVRAFEDGASVVVEFADTGPGIPPDELPHIWEELYRGAGARGVPGSGLGLALARAIILRHGGQVAVRSRAGQGTVFTVRLPVRQPSQPAAAG